MKQKLLLSLLLCLLAVGGAFAEGTREVTQSEAVSLITQKYGSGDVDIYIKQSTTEWTFFIDEYPMRGWPHGVTITIISKSDFAQNHKFYLILF